MASGPAKPPDLEWNRGAVEAFRIVSRTLAPQQAEWLQSQGVDTDRPATEQTGRLDAILVQAQIDKTQAQINVVKAMRSEATRTKLSADDRVFLETEGINPEIPAADQEVRIEKLRDKLEKDEVRAQTDMLQAQIDKTQAQIKVVKAMRSEGKRTNLSADDRVFLETEGINPEIPAADQAVRIDKLLDKLEKDETDMLQAQTDMLQAQMDMLQAQIDKTQAQIKVVKAMRSEGKRTNLSADDRVFLETEGINPEIPAADQAVRIDKLEKDEVRAQTDLLQAQTDKKQAQIDKTQAQINVVKAMRSEATRTNLSADDRVFLETKGINPEIPAAGQEVRIEKLLDKLEKDEVRAQTDMLQAQIAKKRAQINVVKAMRSEGKRTNLSADDRVFLETEGINPEIPAADQEGRIEKLLDKLEKDEVRAQTDLLQAQIDKKQAQMDKTQAQINVVKAMLSEATRKELSADDRVFLETEGINPEIPAADQEVRIEKLLDKLEKEKAAVC